MTENNNLENTNLKSNGDGPNNNKKAPDGTYTKPHLILNGVIMNPVKFFRNMPEKGPLLEPLLFVVIMGALCFFVQIVMVSIGVLPKETPLYPFMIVFPVLAVVEAGFYFLIWNLFGAKTNYSRVFRVICYLHAVTPFAVILIPVPYVNAVVLTIWRVILLIIVSIEFFKIPPKKASIGFGILFIIMLYIQIMSIEFMEDTTAGLQDGNGAVGDYKQDNDNGGGPAGEPFDEEPIKDPFE